MLTKDTFCKIIRALKEAENSTDRVVGGVVDAIKRARPTSDPSEMKWPLYELLLPGAFTDAIIDALKDEFEDNEDEWITYYVYELEFGTKSYAKNCITTKDGKHISLETPEELYDFLMQNIREKKAAEIFGTAVSNDKEVKKPQKERFVVNGTDVDLECMVYSGPEDKIPLQLFTQMYFSECGDVLKGRSTDGDLSVRAGDKVIKMPNGRFCAIPKELYKYYEIYRQPRTV